MSSTSIFDSDLREFDDLEKINSSQIKFIFPFRTIIFGNIFFYIEREKRKKERERERVRVGEGKKVSYFITIIFFLKVKVDRVKQIYYREFVKKKIL